jgi:5-methylcytosine-specific restriction protein A
VHGGGKPEHPWDADDRRQAPARIRGRTLQTLRRLLFSREPLCRLCAAAGRTTIATVRDHIVPLAEGGQDSDDNIQPICDDCNKAKTHAESMRGRRR